MVICALCKEDSELQNSHIIPKFAIKWLKDTSATGLLRSAINPDKPVQDCKKKKLLCKKCELKLSKFENRFAKDVFYPYQKYKKIDFDINEDLLNFAVSVSWRVAVVCLDRFKDFELDMEPHLKKAVEYWNSILNEDKIDKNYEHHILFLNFVNDSTISLHKKFDIYTLRGTDATVCAGPGQVFAYTKLPGIVITSLIYPHANSECVNTKLSVGSKIRGVQTYVHSGFNELLNRRVNEAFKQGMSDRQNNKITERIKNNLNRALQSESFRVKFRRD